VKQPVALTALSLLAVVITIAVAIVLIASSSSTFMGCTVVAATCRQRFDGCEHSQKAAVVLEIRLRSVEMCGHLKLTDEPISTNMQKIGVTLVSLLC